MTEQIKLKTITFSHLGFPLKLVNCPHIEIDKRWEPHINYEHLAEFIFDILPYKPSRLTGAEIKFIRHHMKMTQEQFANWLEDAKDPSSIAVWEKSDLKPTKMDSAMEKSLRLQLITCSTSKNRRKTIKTEVITQIGRSITGAQSACPIKIDTAKLSSKNNDPSEIYMNP